MKNVYFTHNYKFKGYIVYFLTSLITVFQFNHTVRSPWGNRYPNVFLVVMSLDEIPTENTTSETLS